jgi:dehydrogenase/reductase SDR family protein 7B
MEVIFHTGRMDYLMGWQNCDYTQKADAMKKENSEDHPNAKCRTYFKDRVVWVTGASSGIGEQVCMELDRLGAKLIMTARSQEGLERVKAQLPSSGGSARVLPADLEELDGLPDLVARATSLFERIDILINNAGIGMRDYAINTALSVDRKIMTVNYFAAIGLTKLVLPGMLERGFGHIVAVSSMQGKYGIPRSAAYSASKHALHGFFDSLRNEIDTDVVAITILLPGIIATEITVHAMTGTGAKYMKQERSQAEGMPADQAARAFVRAIAARKEEAFVGGSEGNTLWMYRIAPHRVNRMMGQHPLRKLRELKKAFQLPHHRTGQKQQVT